VLFVWEEIRVPGGNPLVKPDDKKTFSHVNAVSEMTFLCGTIGDLISLKR